MYSNVTNRVDWFLKYFLSYNLSIIQIKNLISNINVSNLTIWSNQKILISDSVIQWLPLLKADIRSNSFHCSWPVCKSKNVTNEGQVRVIYFHRCHSCKIKFLRSHMNLISFLHVNVAFNEAVLFTAKKRHSLFLVKYFKFACCYNLK